MLKVVVGSGIIATAILGAAALVTYFSPYQTCVRAVTFKTELPADPASTYYARYAAQISCAKR